MRNAFLGIDTSCYRTSAALYFEDGSFKSVRRLLDTPSGSLGLRQSDAVFMHIKNLPEILSELFSEKVSLKAVGVSVSPTEEEGSYMPVFLSGIMSAVSVSSALNIPIYRFSHQMGHIRAALIGKEIPSFPFLAFHISGGTTECVEVNEGFKCHKLASSLDLKAGQAIDRIGVKMGFPFPAGAYLEKEAQKSSREFKIKPYMKNGCPSLSGLQNKAEKMINEGESNADTARFVFQFIGQAVCEMRKSFPSYKTVVYSGGVTENSIIREMLSGFGSIFADDGLSGDNAVGIAALAGDEYGKNTYLGNTTE